MKLENIDYGTKTKKLHKKLLEGKRKEIMAAIRDFYVNMATDLQKCFYLDASLLMYLKCLDPANCRKTISVARIGHLGQLLPHVITEQEVTLVIETANSNCCRLSKSQIGGLRKAVCHCKTQMLVWIEVFQTTRALLDLKEIISQMKV